MRRDARLVLIVYKQNDIDIGRLLRRTAEENEPRISLCSAAELTAVIVISNDARYQQHEKAHSAGPAVLLALAL